MNGYSFGSALRRREEMLRIIREASVRSQDELQRLLRHRGFPAAQPTLSRDLKELGVAKGPAGYVLPSPLPRLAAALPASSDTPSLPVRREEKLDRTVREFVLSVEPSGSLVVLRTPPADASPVARAIDEAGLREVAGCISGDDTIFLAVRSPVAAARLVRRFRALIAPTPAPALSPVRARSPRAHARKRA